MSLVLSLAASSTPAVTPEPEPEPEPEPDPMVESIDLDCKTGRLAYSSFQINDENFEGHAVILIFDFTNKESKPTGIQAHFFNTAMKDSTMQIAETFMLKDDSPLTIMAEYRSSGDYQMMELDISAQYSGEDGSDPASDSLIS